MLFPNSFYELLPDAHIEGQLGSILQGQICFFPQEVLYMGSYGCPTWAAFSILLSKSKEDRVLSTCLQFLSKCCHYPQNGLGMGSPTKAHVCGTVMILVVVDVNKGPVLLSVLCSYQRPKE